MALGDHDARVAALKRRIAELEAMLEVRTIEITNAEKENDDLLDRLKALEWTEITPENLPKVGDELLDWEGVWNVDKDDVAKGYAGFKRFGATHFRPINAPAKTTTTGHP